MTLFSAGYIPPEFITGDSDTLIIGSEISSGYEFPSGTKISPRQNKIINKTKITGMKGTVKELSGYDDWHITIEFPLLASSYGAGFLAVPANPLIQTMIQKLNELKDLWTKNETLYLTHSVLNAIGIKHIVMESFSLPNSDIHYKQQVSIVVLSDDEYDLDMADVDQGATIAEDLI